MSATDRFIGRDSELDRIGTLLTSSARLITLIGPGGIGKTRLATEAGRRFGKATHRPVHWARLARLTKDADISAVEDEITRSVVAADVAERSSWDALVDALTSTDALGMDLQTLLVLDNCEHVLDAVGEVIAELMVAVPGLTILATSRRPIGWVDEHVVVVPPLSQQQAVTLFRRRAELTGHPVTDTAQVEMAELVCRHVHSNPLYIRLAAARLLRQPLGAIARDLSGEAGDKRLSWSHGPRVGAEPRHQGIRDVIAWSYDLCTAKERLLLDRMSVFAAGYDINPEEGDGFSSDVGVGLEVIESVCADDPGTPGAGTPVSDGDLRLARSEIEGLLEGLVDQSLVTAHITPTRVRYSLLESIRIFAAQRLKERSTDQVDETARLERRHRRYYRDRVVKAQVEWFSPGKVNWGTRTAWDNILTAVETSITSDEPEVGLEISAGLVALPIIKGSPREIRQWTERTLQATHARHSQPSELQTAARTMLGWLSVLQGRNEEADRILDECVAGCVEDPSIGRDWRRHPENDIGLPASVEFLWGSKLMLAHRDPSCIAVLCRAREKFDTLEDRGGEGRSEFYEAVAAGYLGTERQALEVTRRHLDHAIDSGAGWAKSWAQLARAVALARYGDPEEAVAVARSALAVQTSARDQWGISFALHILHGAWARILDDSIAAGNADPHELAVRATETARLLGGATMFHAGPGIDFGALELIVAERQKTTEICRRVLGPDAFAAAYRQGTLLRPELGEVQRLALGTLSIEKMATDHPARKNAPSRWEDLSAAEREVALLAAAGWTNPTIAVRRGTSSRTVDAQMAAIFRKLMVTSRQDIIKLVPPEHLGRVRTEGAKRPHRTGEQMHHPRGVAHPGRTR
ncbi:LuxR C-terminal-related transcriptional regulator [Nocardia paucivorans]|uniref:LuxR C-terminal-related transcriptional regulator n=1 Tax=Nocardia paucivorans TaxID=114259 RepID=UPI00031690BB|nr:LuxR C-terminal-related transcriptional regulator [Nocardia paucivorans]